MAAKLLIGLNGIWLWMECCFLSTLQVLSHSPAPGTIHSVWRGGWLTHFPVCWGAFDDTNRQRSTAKRGFAGHFATQSTCVGVWGLEVRGGNGPRQALRQIDNKPAKNNQCSAFDIQDGCSSEVYTWKHLSEGNNDYSLYTIPNSG